MSAGKFKAIATGYYNGIIISYFYINVKSQGALVQEVRIRLNGLSLNLLLFF
jgi:hypothetical protein